MHPFMMRAFRPYFRRGLLELGSRKGDFTRHFLEHFDDVTCVEASRCRDTGSFHNRQAIESTT